MIRIPGYRLLAEVASGASGTVYRAEQTELARVVALKLLRPGLFGEEETRARFEREARLQASLSHPNLVAVYDAGFAGGQPYLVTEFVEGGSLRDRLDRRPPLAMGEAIALAAEMAAGLACAHEAGIVHRDLKPENVLLTAEGVAKLADFGLARGAPSAHSVRTADGVILGTPGYLAPELLGAGKPTTASDLYALGVILFEMVAGRRPHQRAEPMEELRASSREDAPPLGEFVAQLPSGLEAMVRECLRRSPGDRLAGAAALAAKLETLVPAAGSGGGPARRTVRLDAARPVRAASGSERETLLQPRGPLEARRTAAELARVRWPVAVAAAAVAAALVYVGAGRQQSGSPSPPRAMPAAAVPARAAPLPVPVVTVGADKLVLHLPPRPPRSLLLTWWKRSAPLIRSSKQVESATGPFKLGGFQAGAAYGAELTSAGRPDFRAFEFETLAREGPLLALSPAGAMPRLPVIASAADSVMTAWWDCAGTPQGCAIVTRHSTDGGETWSAPERLTSPSDHTSPLALVAAGEGFQLAWLAMASDGSVNVLTSFRHETRAGWSSPVTLPTDRPPGQKGLVFPHGLALEPGAEPTRVDLVTCLGGGEGAKPHALGLSRFRAGDLRPPALSPLILEPRDDSSLCLARAGPRLHLFERSWSRDTQADSLRWFWVDDGGLLKPGGLARVTAPGEGVDGLVATAGADGRLLLVYKANGFLHSRVLPPGSEHFSGATRVTGTSSSSLFFREDHPSLGVARGKYCLAFLEGHPVTDQWTLFVATSTDGLAWVRRFSRKLPIDVMTDTGVAVTSDALGIVIRQKDRAVFFTRFPLAELGSP